MSSNTAGIASSCLRLARWRVNGSLSMTRRDVGAEVEVEDRTGTQVRGSGGKLQHCKTKISPLLLDHVQRYVLCITMASARGLTL